MTLRRALLVLGVLAATAAVATNPVAAQASASRTWPPFVLVAGLLVLGAVAHQEGVFEAAGGLLDSLPGGDGVLFAAAMGLVALVTVLLNLDTSVAFLTPVLVSVGRRRGRGVDRLLYGCVFMSNAASLLLPGSNLTNLLVLDGRGSGLRFASSMLGPWIAAVFVTAVGVAVAFRRGQKGSALPALTPAPVPGAVSLLGITAAVVAILLLPNAAPAVLAIAIGVGLIGLVQGRISLAAIFERIDLISLAGLFGVTTALGTLATGWAAPAHIMASAGRVTSAVYGAVASVALNNLPAAVLLGSRSPAHPTSLLLGLNIGPNLAVSGSLSALIWWQSARALGEHPSVVRYSKIGVVLVPITLALCLAMQRI